MYVYVYVCIYMCVCIYIYIYYYVSVHWVVKCQTQLSTTEQQKQIYVKVKYTNHFLGPKITQRKLYLLK